MPIQSGSKLGPYEIVSAAGAGGMGEVYRAKDTRLDRIVAIKVLPGHLSSDPALKERFEREARAVSALSHPAVRRYNPRARRRSSPLCHPPRPASRPRLPETLPWSP
jgi:serine/threonine protein kinase